MTEKFYVTDTDLSERFPIYTRANVGEVFPDPVTPLTSDSGLWFAELGWRDAWERMGGMDLAEFPPDEFCTLGVVGGYCYLNASVIRLFGERAPGLSWQAIDAQFFGAQPGIPDYEEMEGDVRPDLTARIGATFQWVFAQQTLDDLTELTEDRRETLRLRAERPDFDTMTDRELWDRSMDLLDLHRKLFCQHIFTTYMATVPMGTIAEVATTVGRPDLILPIVSGIGSVDSVAPSLAMWEMGRMVAGSTELTAAFDAGVDGLLARIEGEVWADDFIKAFEAFALDFGSRGPNEWETRSPTWETRPELALSAIERMRCAPDELAPSHQHTIRAGQRASASEELLELVAGDPETHGTLMAAISCSAAWLPGRERTKTNNIRLIHEMRMPLRALGQRLVDRGAFDQIEDFGFVRLAELETLMNDPHVLTDAIRLRRGEYEQLQELTPTFVFVGADGGPATWSRRDEVSSNMLSPGDTIEGVPGCVGVAEGRARVVLDSNDPSALEPGDILVAPITDPSWTPLFVPAAAVVVDVGAPLSHAIIVSRELGIPCVVSVTDGTRRIPHGARIRVDGGTGVITLL